jgi:hypothetical protein
VRSDGGKYHGTFKFEINGFEPVPGPEDTRPWIDRVKRDATKIADLQHQRDQATDPEKVKDLDQQLLQAEGYLETDLGQAIQNGGLPGSASIGPLDLGSLRYCRAPNSATRGREKRYAQSRAHPRTRPVTQVQSRSRRLCSATAGPFFSLATPNVYLGGAADGREAAYWLSAGRQPTLLIEDGMSTSVGKIRQVYVQSLHWGSGGAWNNYYQVALIADIAAGPGGLQDAILLLTPTAVP